MLARRCLATWLVVLLLWPGTLARVPANAASQGGILNVGQLELTPCEEQARLWCGSLPVPLDRDDPGAASLEIGFAWRSALHVPSRGTLVVQEGGPGYPTIGSYSLWRELFRPLLRDHDLLMVDARGTGRSYAIDCPGLQTLDAAQSQSEQIFQDAIAACGRQLNETFERADGAFVHASDLFGTADAVDDLAAVIAALEAGPVDLYGNSYGSYFAQAFAARHPELVRSVILDATWALLDSDPWYPETHRAMRFAFDAACQRSAACNAAAPGSATARLAALAEALDETPLSGEVPRSDKEPEAITVAATDLAAIAWTAGVSATIYRDLDAAGRAALAGDPQPLLRLASTAGLNGTLSGGWPAATYSVGLAVAVPCTDYPQVFDMAASEAERAAAFEAAAAALPAGAFWPFAQEVWLGNPIQDYDQCLTWPAPTHERELAPHELPLVPPTLPMLMLAGDLDTFTAPGGAEVALRQLGPSARLILVPSNTHVVAQGDIVGCGTAIVREFLHDPERLWQLDTSCVDRFPEIRATGVFPARLADQPLPAPGPDNQASVEAQRLAALAVSAAGDAIAYQPKKGEEGPGLRGGTIAAGKEGEPRVLTLSGVRYVTDAVVDGTVTIPKDPTAPITAELIATAADGTEVAVTASWQPQQEASLAAITGTTGDGSPISVTMPAP